MSVIIDYLPINDTQRIGRIILNKPQALNAQDLQMVRKTSLALDMWADDDSVVAVLLSGAGQKAFCAGGDIRGLYHTFNPELFPNPVADEFFTTEYALCKRINSYDKPIIVWASGIVMGGGMGLAVPASHRIVTETTMMAMPEVSIGLFADAGASYFLGKMPDKIGLFLGLTGARFNGADALSLGVADFAMASTQLDRLVNALMAAIWQQDSMANHQMLDELLANLQDKTVLGEGWLLPHYQVIAQIMQVQSLEQFDQIARQGSPDAYIQQAFDTYKQGSPTSASLAWHLNQKTQQMSFDEVLDLERIVAVRCMHYGEFAEGVRALLIDKDKNPKWRYTLDDLPQAHIQSHFQTW